MKVIISIFLSVSILTVVLFSFASMDMGENHICPISIFTGTDCIVMTNVFSMAEYHLSAISKLTLAVFQFKDAATMIIYSAFLALFSWKFRSPGILSAPVVFTKRYLSINKLNALAGVALLLEWLALHNKGGIGDTA